MALLLVAGTVTAVLLTRDDKSGGDFDAGDQLRGVAVLFDMDGSIEGSWDDCEGTGGYGDFGAGMRLSVKGSDGEVVGSGDVTNVDESMMDTLSEMNDKSGWLSDGPESPEDIEELLRDGEGFMCVLYFEADIKDSDFYAIELGSRGDLSYSREDLEENGFTVSFSLGDM